MADDEKPTSIWKKEISFRRKPADEAADAPAASGPSSIWKKEISLRKKDAEHEAMPELDPELAEPVEAEPDLDAAIAALSLPAEPPAVEPEPVAPPVPSVEHGWLTQPLEEVSEPPAEVVSPVSLVPDVVEPVVVPIAAVPVPEPEPEPIEPEPALDLELELDLPTAVLPALEVEAAWPGEPEGVEPELAPSPSSLPSRRCRSTRSSSRSR